MAFQSDKMKADLERDRECLAEFGCLVCNTYRIANRKPARCVWKSKVFGAKDCYGCPTLKAALDKYLDYWR